MENKVYYGEYTLMHWINMMLTGNIVLPDYQRHFVWREKDVKRLLQSLSDGQFVQPVTIALYNDGTTKQNLILDGQQRLTSLLLAYLGYFPDKKKFETGECAKVASEDDSAADDESKTSSEGFLWQYSDLLKYGKSKLEILSKICTDERYIKTEDTLISGLTDEFFNKTYLGFSYVVPDTVQVTEVQKSFSQMFRNINYFGKKLEPIDSRKSLYYQNQELIKYFEGKCDDGTDVFGNLRIIEDLQPSKIDFVRYLAILSQYVVSIRPDDAKDVMVGYSAYGSRESFYADYVSYILGIEQEDRTDKFERFSFDRFFPNGAWKARFYKLRDALVKVKPLIELKDKTSFNAWYEADYWLFGLIYQILFKGTELNDDLRRVVRGKMRTLRDDVERQVKDDRSDIAFSKNANRIGFIRKRLVVSCNIFEHYVH